MTSNNNNNNHNKGGGWGGWFSSTLSTVNSTLSVATSVVSDLFTDPNNETVKNENENENNSNTKPSSPSISPESFTEVPTVPVLEVVENKSSSTPNSPKKQEEEVEFGGAVFDAIDKGVAKGYDIFGSGVNFIGSVFKQTLQEEPNQNANNETQRGTTTTTTTTSTTQTQEHKDPLGEVVLEAIDKSVNKGVNILGEGVGYLGTVFQSGLHKVQAAAPHTKSAVVDFSQNIVHQSADILGTVGKKAIEIISQREESFKKSQSQESISPREKKKETAKKAPSFDENAEWIIVNYDEILARGSSLNVENLTDFDFGAFFKSCGGVKFIRDLEKNSVEYTAKVHKLLRSKQGEEKECADDKVAEIQSLFSNITTEGDPETDTAEVGGKFTDFVAKCFESSLMQSENLKSEIKTKTESETENLLFVITLELDQFTLNGLKSLVYICIAGVNEINLFANSQNKTDVKKITTLSNTVQISISRYSDKLIELLRGLKLSGGEVESKITSYINTICLDTDIAHSYILDTVKLVLPISQAATLESIAITTSTVTPTSSETEEPKSE